MTPSRRSPLGGYHPDGAGVGGHFPLHRRSSGESASDPQVRELLPAHHLKLLNSYQRLSSQSVKGENITSTMFNIAGMMHTVADAFEKQLDSLFSEEAMDISADITVFETLLKQEGFVERGEKGKWKISSEKGGPLRKNGHTKMNKARSFY